MSKILVTGSNGQLGKELKELSSNYNHDFFFLSKSQLDITNYDKLNEFITNNKIDTIINTAAYTAVDLAESVQELADEINHLAVVNIAKLSKKYGIKLVHISTDFVFDGQNSTPYSEDITPAPLSVYGKTKLLGEKAIQKENLHNSVIIRTSWVYSHYGKNFVKTISNLANQRDTLNIIFDQIGTPTYAHDLAKVILEILPKISNKQTQIYHYSNEGVCSWYDFAQEIIEKSNIECIICPIETKEYPTPAIRPKYSILNKSKIKREFDIIIPYWKKSLMTCIDKIKKSK